MNGLAILLGIIALCVVALAGINFYLISLVRQLERENESLQPPF